METTSLNETSCLDGIIMKIIVRALGAQMRKVYFVETGFAGETEFICVHYSATNSVLPKNK
jgi:hypothetical protein